MAMRLFRLGATLAFVVAWVGGCKSRDLQLKDTEGRAFVARCSSKGCSLEQKSGPRAASDHPDLILRGSGRLIGVCSTRQGGEPEPGDCRPLLCSGSEECPPAEGLSHGECLNGLCIEPSHSIDVNDAVLLCLAGTGLGRESAAQVERYALALNCGTPCRIPAPCQKP